MVDKEGKGTAGLRVSIERSRRGRNQMVAMGGATDRTCFIRIRCLELRWCSIKWTSRRASNSSSTSLIK